MPSVNAFSHEYSPLMRGNDHITPPAFPTATAAWNAGR
jgi:hypothetical protein